MHGRYSSTTANIAVWSTLWAHSPNAVFHLEHVGIKIGRPKSTLNRHDEVFVTDGEKAIGAVRAISRKGNAEVTIYVENAGDFQVPGSSIEAVHSQKVILKWDALDSRLQTAIKHAHDREDPSI